MSYSTNYCIYIIQLSAQDTSAVQLSPPTHFPFLSSPLPPPGPGTPACFRFRRWPWRTARMEQGAFCGRWEHETWIVREGVKTAEGRRRRDGTWESPYLFIRQITCAPLRLTVSTVQYHI